MRKRESGEGVRCSTFIAKFHSPCELRKGNSKERGNRVTVKDTRKLEKQRQSEENGSNIKKSELDLTTHCDLIGEIDCN